MTLSKSEFCEFSLNARYKLVKEFGQFIIRRTFVEKKISVYKIYEFHVEAVHIEPNNRLLKIEPIFSMPLLNYYITLHEQ